MKLIKKAPKQVENKLANLNVGDKVVLKTYRPDGRMGTIVGTFRFTVTQVNKVTFDGVDKEGNVYRINQDENWKVVA